MMNSYRRSEKRTRTLVLATAAVAFVLLVDFLSGGIIRSSVRLVGSAISERGSAIGGAVLLSGLFSTRASLARENAALKAQIARLQDRAAFSAAVESENSQLRALTHLAQTHPGITAPITSSFRSSPYGTFTVGAGSSDGVAVGALVLTPDGFIVGRLSEVGNRESLVTELFAPKQQLDVIIDSTPLTLTGIGGGVASGRAPRGATIALETAAVAPSLGQRPVGTVGHVEGDGSSASIQVLVRIPLNLSSLPFVYVEIAH